MKRSGLPLAMLGVLLVTAIVLYWSGWITPRVHASSTSHAQVHEQRPTDAAMHYRQNAPSHWRCCMLEH